MPHRLFGYILLGVILGSPLLLTGGNEVLFTILLGLTLLLSFLFLLKQSIDGALKVPLRLFLAFIGCQLLTLIPIPVTWIRWLSPGLHKVLLNFPEIAYHTLSWDAILTMKTLAIYVAAAGVFLVAYHLWEDPLEKVPFVVQLFFWTGTFWVAVSLWLHYTTPGSVPFLPWQPEPWFFGLFTNGNIFGTFCAMLIPLGIVTGIYFFKVRRAKPGAFPIPFIVLGLLGFGIFAGRALGAAIAAGSVIILMFCPWKRFAIPVLLLALVLFGSQATELLNRESEDSLESRVRFGKLGFQLVTQMPLAGSGLGTMHLVGPCRQEPAGDRIVNKLHNDWLELAATAGMSSLLIYACIGIFAWSMAPMLRRISSFRAGIAGCILVPAMHSTVDFPLQNITVLMWVCVLSGFLYRLSEGRPSLILRRDGTSMRILVFAGLVISGLLILGLVRVRQKRMSAWQPQRSLSLAARTVEEIGVFQTHHRMVAESWERLSLLYEGSNDFPNAMEALGRALVLRPRSPALRLEEARLRFILGDEDGSVMALTDAFALSPGVDTLSLPISTRSCDGLFINGLTKACAYYGEGAEGHLTTAYSRAGEQCPTVRSRLARLGVTLLPKSFKAHNIQAEQFLVEGAPSAALEAAERAYGVANNATSCLLAARAAAANGDDDGALRWLRRGLQHTGGDRNRWLAIAGVQALSDHALGESIELLKEAHGAHPDAFTTLEIANRLQRMQQTAEAAQWYEITLKYNDKLELAYRNYLNMLKSTGDSRRLEVGRRARLHFPEADWLKDVGPDPRQ